MVKYSKGKKRQLKVRYEMENKLSVCGIGQLN